MLLTPGMGNFDILFCLKLLPYFCPKLPIFSSSCGQWQAQETKAGSLALMCNHSERPSCFTVLSDMDQGSSCSQTACSLCSFSLPYTLPALCNACLPHCRENLPPTHTVSKETLVIGYALMTLLSPYKCISFLSRSHSINICAHHHRHDLAIAVCLLPASHEPSLCPHLSLR